MKAMMNQYFNFLIHISTKKLKYQYQEVLFNKYGTYNIYEHGFPL